MAIALLFGCSGEADEAKKLGFSSVDEMKEVQSKGWHTQQKYFEDNPQIANAAEEKRLNDEKQAADAKADVERKKQRENIATDLTDNNWYVVDRLLKECKIDAGGPAGMIKNLQIVRATYRAVDEDKVGDTPVRVSIEIPSQGGAVIYYRGLNRCNESLDADKTAKEAEVNRYK